MILKINKISIKSLVWILSVIYVSAGFVLGLIVTIASLVSPPDQEMGGVGAWAVLLFPIINGLLGCLTAMFLASMYNFLAGLMGGVVIEAEDTNPHN